MHLPAAIDWARYEASSATLLPNPLLVHELTTRSPLSLARIEAHYYGHGCFLQSSQLLNRAHAIVNLPCIIVQGKYDLLSPMRSASRLHDVLPKSTLISVPDAGHSAFDTSITRELVAATERMKAEPSPS